MYIGNAVSFRYSLYAISLAIALCANSLGCTPSISKYGNDLRFTTELCVMSIVSIP